MKILIGGDISPKKAEVNELFAKGDVKTLFNGVADIAKQADRFIVNLECALTTTEKGIKKIGPCLKSDPKCADTLKKLGVTDVALSNNHVFDYGIQGLKDTMENLERVGLPYLDMIMLDNDSYMHEFYDMTKTLDAHPHTAENYKEYLPDIWKNATAEQKALGYGGMDYFECRAFIDAILNGTEMPIDVYDMASWMAITPLSEQSIAHGGMPQAIPDFTRGKWILREMKDVVEFPKVSVSEEKDKNKFGYSRD